MLSEREQEAAGADDDSASKFGPSAHRPGTSQEKDATDSHEILADEFTEPRDLCLRYKDQRKKERNTEGYYHKFK